MHSEDKEVFALEYPSYEEASLKMILHGGNAKSEIQEALKASRAGLFEEAEDHLDKADEEIQLGHDIQLKLLKSEEDGTQLKINLFLIHAYNYLSSVATERTLAGEIVGLHRKLSRVHLHFA
jgi:cellobiose PTS system EIIA component